MAISSKTKKPIYSDSTQTAASRNAIWKKLVKDPECEVVGYDQKTKKDFDIEEKNGEFVINDNQFQYASGDDSITTISRTSGSFTVTSPTLSVFARGSCGEAKQKKF